MSHEKPFAAALFLAEQDFNKKFNDVVKWSVCTEKDGKVFKRLTVGIEKNQNIDLTLWICPDYRERIYVDADEKRFKEHTLCQRFAKSDKTMSLFNKIIEFSHSVSKSNTGVYANVTIGQQ